VTAQIDDPNRLESKRHLNELFLAKADQNLRHVNKMGKVPSPDANNNRFLGDNSAVCPNERRISDLGRSIESRRISTTLKSPEFSIPTRPSQEKGIKLASSSVCPFKNETLNADAFEMRSGHVEI
jgi:hypothetical protein